MKKIYLASSIALMAASGTVFAAPTEAPGLPGSLLYSFNAQTDMKKDGNGGSNTTCHGYPCIKFDATTSGNRGRARNNNPMDLSNVKDAVLTYSVERGNATLATSTNTNFSYGGNKNGKDLTENLSSDIKYFSLRQSYGACCIENNKARVGGFRVNGTYLPKDASLSIVDNGEPVRGDTLTAVLSDANGITRATSGSVNDAEYAAVFTWTSEDGILQTGASNSYEVQFSDSYDTISVSVSYYDDHAFEEADIVSTTSVTFDYLGDGVVTVSGQSGANGEPSVGDILVPTTDQGAGDQILTAPVYTWFVGTDNRGTFEQYEVVSSDFENPNGSTITVVSDFTDDDEGQESVSTETLAVIRADDTLGTLEIAGKSKVGLVLTADLADTDGIEAGSVSYSWQKFDAITDLAFGPELSIDAEYTVREDDLAANNGNPAYISLAVNYTDKLGYEQSLAAQSDTVYLNLAGEVNVSGLTEVGQTLTASVSDEDGIDGDVIYNWYQADNEARDENVRLLNGNSNKVELLPLSEGKFVWVETSYFDVDGTEETPRFDVPTAIDPKGTTPPPVAPATGCAYNPNARSLDMLMLLLAACGLFYFRKKLSTQA